MTCIDEHYAVGYVTNQVGDVEPGRAHASRYVCDRDACQRAAKAWVRRRTGERGIFVLFARGDR